MPLDLTEFYQQLKVRTGVDLSTPVQDPIIQSQIQAKEQIAQVSDVRSEDRMAKRISRQGSPSKPSGLPSLYVQAARANQGQTLLTGNTNE